MIKAITVVRRARSKQEFEAAADFFETLGFEKGKGWSDARSQGQPFEAAIGAIEFVDGDLPASPDILIEVDDLDSLHRIAKERFPAVVKEVEETHWASRLFVAEPVTGVRLGFWAFNDPKKHSMEACEGDLRAEGMRFGIVVSRWNSFITERLLTGAIDALVRTGVARNDIRIVRVPGAFEIPSAGRSLAESKSVDAVITLGCLIRGETTHYEHIATEVTRGIGQAAQETGIPHTYGVLTCESLDQAIDRAGLKQGNKGFEAAISAVEMVSLQRKLRQAPIEGGVPISKAGTSKASTSKASTLKPGSK